MRTKLTAAQKVYLCGLRDNPERFEGYGVTNPTMSALEKRGYTKIEIKPNPGGWTDFLWCITSAGKIALSPNPAPHGDTDGGGL